MPDEYIRQRLHEAIESHRKSIADLEEKLSRQESPDLRRQIEWHEREIQKLEAKLQLEVKLSKASPHPQPQVAEKPKKSSPPPQQPGQISMVVTWLAFAIVLLAGFSLSAYFLQELWVILTVFLAYLITLTVLPPFIGLNIRIVKESNWFKAYLAALKKIPGLGVLVDALTRQ